MVAPLLTMCFLVAYAFMTISCFTLTWLRSPAWRPAGIHRIVESSRLSTVSEVCWQAAWFVAVSRCLRYFCSGFGDVLGGDSDFDDGAAVDVLVAVVCMGCT